jgi:outer membrane protein assembly factor BamD
MLNNRFYKAICFLTALFIIVSCSQYEKAIKSDDVDFKFSKAFYFYNKGVYIKASALFEQLAPLVRGTRKADSVFYYQAMTNYKLNDFILAGHYFKNFVTMYENSSLIEDAAYMEAYCYYLQSPRPELDQKSTYQALTAFQLYMIKYPGNKHMEECRKIIVELNEKIMEKEFMAAQLYYNIENYKAAITSLNTCLLDYPDSKYREEIIFMLLKSKYLLAANSVSTKQTERYQDAIDEYFSFKTEYPESENMKEAENIYKSASDFINEKEIINN